MLQVNCMNRLDQEHKHVSLVEKCLLFNNHIHDKIKINTKLYTHNQLTAITLTIT